MEQAKGMDKPSHEEILAEAKSAAVDQPATTQHIEDEPAPRLHSKTFLVVAVSRPDYSTILLIMQCKLTCF